MMKQIKEGMNKWKDLEHLILLKCLCYPRRVTDSVAFQNTNALFIEIEQKNPLICMEAQKTLHAQNNLEKEEHG